VVPISQITPYARNPRKNDAAVAKVAASIKEFGWRQPIVVDSEGVVIAGHTRLLAAQRLGLADVPVHVATGLTPGQVKAYRLMDNRSGQEAEWDTVLLPLEIADLKELGYDLELTGFDEDEIAALFGGGTEGLTDPDEVPPVPEVPVTQPGDLIVLGNHRLLCGDATVATDVERLLAGLKPILMVTDPPYGVEYDPKWRAEAGVNKNKAKMGTVANDDRADWREAWALFPGDVAYVWHDGKMAREVQNSIEACGFEIRSQIIWAKDRFALSRGHYHWQHEPCWYACRGGGHWSGDRSQSTLWSIKSRDDGGHGHGTQKPVECMKRPIENNSSPGQSVYDPFLGSGTTIIAAEMMGRVCYGLEIDPRYCDVIVQRWENFTGKKAERVPRGDRVAV
jgi:DNA modification methylase